MDTDRTTAPKHAADDFGELFDRHSRPLYIYLARRTDETVAEDLLSETFLIAFERRALFDRDRTQALPWLFGIATNLLRRHRRQELRGYRAMSRSIEASHVDPPNASDDRLDMRRALGGVARALAQMPTAVRETVLLFAWAELSYEQIATATAVPVGTVRSRLNRARTALRAVPGALETLTGADHG